MAANLDQPGLGRGGDPVLQLDGVGVRYGTLTAVHGIDLTVDRGERVAIIGPSGSGKSTLLNLAAGLVSPTAGSVAVLGVALPELSGRALRAHRSLVGVVGQQLGLAPSLRVVHNVNAGRLGSWSTIGAVASLARPARRAEVARALDLVGLAERADARTEDLSGGEQQRVAVARVLHQGPELVLADEPTSSVDPRLSDVVMGLLTDGPASWTSIITAHDPDLARRHARRIIGLRDGGIIFDLPTDDVTDTKLVDLYRDR